MKIEERVVEILLNHNVVTIISYSGAWSPNGEHKLETYEYKEGTRMHRVVTTVMNSFDDTMNREAFLGLRMICGAILEEEWQTDV